MIPNLVRLLAAGALLFLLWRGGRRYLVQSRQWIDQLHDVPDAVDRAYVHLSRVFQPQSERHERHSNSYEHDQRSINEQDSTDALIAAATHQHWKCATCSRSIDGRPVHLVQRGPHGRDDLAVCSDCIQRHRASRLPGLVRVSR